MLMKQSDVGKLKVYYSSKKVNKVKQESLQNVL